MLLYSRIYLRQKQRGQKTYKPDRLYNNYSVLNNLQTFSSITADISTFSAGVVFFLYKCEWKGLRQAYKIRAPG